MSERNIYLCGHTGSVNRGCEAIVRSTVKILNDATPDASVILCSFNEKDDIDLGVNSVCNIIHYNTIKEMPARRCCAKLLNLLFRDYLFSQACVQDNLFSRVKQGDLLLQIGGDTYCYGRPVVQFAANRFAARKKVANVLWSCSIENINEEIKNDLEKYVHIFPRETLTYSNLIDAGIPANKITLMADSAFVLNEKESAYAHTLNLDNTVGINISPVSMDLEASQGCAFKNMENLISYLLNQTDMSVTLIPHVYRENFQDLLPLEKLFQEFKESGRIQIVREKLTCEELKYIIAKCRFFVGARTHATIAAYSSCVPTLTLGYSIKSKGIAIDLFGTDKNYVVSTQQLKTENDLLDGFLWIAEHDEPIRKQLCEIIPVMQQKIFVAGEKLSSLINK